MDGVLQVHWSYSEAVHRRETIERLANDYLTSLLATVRHCQSPEAGGYTPSDFPLAGVSQADLEQILMAKKSGQAESAISDLYPLTPLQQGLWFHELLDPGSGTYFRKQRHAHRRAAEPRCVPAGLGRAVMARHPVLRTRIVWEGLEHPLQLVQKSVELPWAEEDWRDSPADEHQARLSDFLDEDRARGLELAQAPLMRLTLLRVAEHSAILDLEFSPLDSGSLVG